MGALWEENRVWEFQSPTVKSALLYNTKALTKYKWPKMKRDARQKCSLFLRTAFLVGISLHFRPLIFIRALG
jgi:hypothetical protein